MMKIEKKKKEISCETLEFYLHKYKTIESNYNYTTNKIMNLET